MTKPPQCYKDLQLHFKGQTPVYQNEYRIRGKDNRYRWILDRGKVIEWSEEGQPPTNYWNPYRYHGAQTGRKNSSRI